MRFPSALALALCVLLVASAAGAATVTVAAAAGAPADPKEVITDPSPESQVTDANPSPEAQVTAADPSPEPQVAPTTDADEQPPLEYDDPRQVIHLNLTDDGTVRWTIESRYLIHDEDDEALFFEYAEAVSSGERDAGYDVQLFERFLSLAQETTDREMEIQDAGWDEPRVENRTIVTEIENGDGDDENGTKIGSLSYSFAWTEFASVDDNRVYFGDAFATPDGTWFPALTENQRLVIHSPEGYGFDHAPPVEQRNGALVWDGPHEFGDGELEIVYLRGADSNGSPTPPADGGVSWELVGAAAIAVGAILAVLGYLYVIGRLPVRRADDAETGRPAEAAVTGREVTDREVTEGETSPGAGREETRFDEREALESMPEESAEAATGADDVDLELLSDEERVLRLLRANGGRMKQASIVKETGWSNAKVSQLLSKMDDEDEIEKLRIGRENLITLPEVDPTEID